MGNRIFKKSISMLIASVMVLTSLFANVGTIAYAEESTKFVEVAVPNGDFESGEAAWTFTGEIENKDYYWTLFQNSYMTTNLTTLYEVCSKKGSSYTKSYSASQTITGLEPGIYKASIEATGGNDGGKLDCKLNANGVSVAVTPNKWNVWNTYTTDTFAVAEDGKCNLSITTTATGEYLDMDNVKLWKQVTEEVEPTPGETEEPGEPSPVQVIKDTDAGAVDFNADWQFYLATRTPAVNGKFETGGLLDAGDYTTAQIIDPKFNDGKWRTVDVPHDFSIEGEKVSNGSSSQAYMLGGLAYYRKTFTLPASMKDKKTISIDFEGVYQNSVVYLNGKEIGNYPSGYTGFAYDITDSLIYGGENVIVVKVQNMSPSGRWYTGSGIVRPVHLVIDELTHFSREGIVLSTPTLKDDYKSGKALMNVNARGYSDASNSVAYMEVKVKDANGKVVATQRTEDTAINPSTAFTLSLEGANAVEVPSVQLWYPWNIGNPYLYDVEVNLYSAVDGSEDGFKLVDTETIPYGFRWYEIQESTSDPASGGLYVNGKYTKVQGVDLHHDSGSLGGVSYKDAYMREMSILKSMGVNSYRTSHCPPSKQMIEVCRELGILVFEEAYDGWGSKKATYDFGLFFFNTIPESWAGLKPNGFTSVPASTSVYEGAQYVWSDWVIQEMVRRDINEPSIFAWSVGNEIRGVGTAPSWYKPAEYDVLDKPQSKINEYTEAIRLMRDIKAVDSSRLVGMGGDQQRSVPSATATWGLVNQALDGYGLNYNTAKSVDGLINRFSIGDSTLLEKGSKTFFFESESSSQTSSRGVYLDPQFTNTGINQTPGSRGGSNYDNDFASWTMSNEYGLKKDRDRKSFIGQFIWSGFDYLGEPTPYSVYPVGVSSFGTIDTAGFPKDSYYLFRSQWTTDPLVHLVPQNWDEYHDGEEVEVWVNANVQTAELFLNGESLGKKSFDEKETAYGKKYYETSEKTVDDKSWGDSSNPGGYTSPGAVLDEGELNSGKLHLTWKVPYEAGTLEVKAYDKAGNVVATDKVATAGSSYTVSAVPTKTVLKADGQSLTYVECTIVDEKGNMVPDAADLVKFDVTGPISIFGVDNGQQESAELYKYGNVEKNTHSERSAYHGKVLVILKSEKTTGDAELTISGDQLVPVKLGFAVTADGTGKASSYTVTSKAVSVDPVAITIPTGLKFTLPSSVKVNYEAEGKAYYVMKPVTWSALKDGKAEGTIAGEPALKAQLTVTEKADYPTDVELATNTALGANNQIFDVNLLPEAGADYALATATFTGNTKNYPNNMLDGNASTSWTNAYSRGASVLLPANSASRRSEYVTLYWKAPKLMNQITMTFTETAYVSIPKTLEVEYWDGIDWVKATGLAMEKESGQPVIMKFAPVYSDKIRVYMENGTPYTTTGNIGVAEASVMLSTTPLGAVDKTELNAAIKEAEGITSGMFTVESYEAFLKVLDTVKAVAANEEATKEEVAAALEALNAANAALKVPSAEDYFKVLDELKKAQEALEACGARYEEAQKAIESAQNELKAAAEEKKALEDTITALEADKLALAGQIDALNKKLEAADADKKALQAQISALETEKASLIAQLDSVKKDLEAAKAEIAATEKKVEDAKAETAKVKAELDKAREDAEAAKKVSDALLAAKEAELQAQKDINAALNKSLEDSKAQVTSIKESLDKALALIEELQNREAAGDADVTKLKEEIAAQKATIAGLEAQLAAEKAHAASFEKLLNSSESRFDSLEAQIKALTEELIKTRQSIDEALKMKDEIISIKDQIIKDKDDIITDKDREITQAKEDAEQALKDKIAAIEAAQRAEAERKALEEELKKAQAALDAMLAANALKTGDTTVVNGVKYRVIDAAEKTVAAYGVSNKKAKTLTVAATVTIKDTSCKVVEVSARAFSGMTKLTKATIGKNVAKIGSRAFYGDKNLKTIIIKSTALTSVGANAFKNIHAKAVIKVPASKLSAYKKLLKGKGQKGTVKIKK